MNDPKNDILNFLKQNGVLTLAVAKESQPWVCTLYYGIDDDFNMYLVSDPTCKHGKILQENSRVAFNVFDSHTKITENKKGIQGEGLCEVVKNPIELLKGITLWHQFNPGIESKITFEDLQKIPDTRLFRIKPTYLKIFDKSTYGGDGYKEVNL